MDTKKVADYVLQFEQEYESSERKKDDPVDIAVCSLCFKDQGLRWVAEAHGFRMDTPCPRCGLPEGIKLDRKAVRLSMRAFLSLGTLSRGTYGGAPALVCNPRQATSIELAEWANGDLALLSEVSGWGVVEYGPRLWMLGYIEPLEALQQVEQRNEIIDRILNEYPVRNLTAEERFYRMRLNVEHPELASEFDSPPLQYCGAGRLDSIDFPVLYGSQDLEVCIHECRTAVDDDAYVATLSPSSCDLKLLDLSHILSESVTEFESLDLAIHMLFLAKSHSYEIAREIAKHAKARGLDGLIYPSYFSLVRTGAIAFETVLGMSIRHHRHDLGTNEYVTRQVIPNIGIFGHPVRDGRLEVKAINRVIIRKAEYLLNFGPVGFRSINENTN